MDWDEHAEREEGRYADGLARLPDDPDARQKQLVRVAMAATGAGLARLMQGRRAEAAGWFARSAERFRESYADAPPGELGPADRRDESARCSPATARVQRRTPSGPSSRARPVAESPIGRYAAVLALLVLGRDDEAAARRAAALGARRSAFPRPVAEALAALAAGDGDAVPGRPSRACSPPSRSGTTISRTSPSPTRSSCSRRSRSAAASRRGSRSPLLPEVGRGLARRRRRRAPRCPRRRSCRA